MPLLTKPHFPPTLFGQIAVVNMYSHGIRIKDDFELESPFASQSSFPPLNGENSPHNPSGPPPPPSSDSEGVSTYPNPKGEFTRPSMATPLETGVQGCSKWNNHQWSEVEVGTNGGMRFDILLIFLAVVVCRHTSTDTFGTSRCPAEPNSRRQRMLVHGGYVAPCMEHVLARG